ncbi:MAG: hypothetical protein AAGG09_00375 [Pseudomonadota bacterium]
MAVYPASIVLLLIWALLSLRRPANGLLVAMAALPFGMFAAVEVSGLSLRAAHFAAALSLALITVQHFSTPSQARTVRISPAGLWIFAFAVYGLFSAIFLVRIFQGQFLVFPVSLGAVGPATSIHFSSTMAPVWPSSSNISQLGYVLIACAYFLFLDAAVRRHGVGWVERALVAAGALNCGLAALDLAGADALLEPVRTADYALANEQAVAALPRVIGGFSEPAPFGAISAAFFGYFAVSYLMSRKPAHGLLALGNLVCVLLSLSSSGLMSMAVAVLAILAHLRHFTAGGVSRVFSQVAIATVCCVIAAFSMILIATPLADFLAVAADRLFLSKAGSLSGLERSAWAFSGLDAFVSSYGLGAGVGSLRSNGLVPVMLGSVGLLGTAFYALFLWFSIARPARVLTEADPRRVYLGARVAALTALTSAMVAATVPDPDLVLMTFVALAAASWQLGRRPAEDDGGFEPARYEMTRKGIA